MLRGETLKDDNNWHLDKKVPLALIAVLVVQFASGLLAFASVRAQGEATASRVSVLEAAKVSERLSSLEAQMTDAKSLLLRMDMKIDRLNERQQR